MEHRRGDAHAVVARALDFDTAAAAIPPLAARLRQAGATGDLILREEAFGTIVAFHPLWPADTPFTPYHER